MKIRKINNKPYLSAFITIFFGFIFIRIDAIQARILGIILILVSILTLSLRRDEYRIQIYKDKIKFNDVNKNPVEISYDLIKEWNTYENYLYIITCDGYRYSIEVNQTLMLNLSLRKLMKIKHNRKLILQG